MFSVARGTRVVFCNFYCFLYYQTETFLWILWLTSGEGFQPWGLPTGILWYRNSNGNKASNGSKHYNEGLISQQYSLRKINELFCEKGLLTLIASDNIVRLAPPLIITNKEVDKAIEIMKKVLEKIND